MKLPKVKFNKSSVSSVLIVIYIIASVVVIGFFALRELRDEWREEGFEVGQQSLIQALIQDAANCTPIPVFNEETQVDLIDINCFQAEAQQEGTTEGQ